MSDIEHTHMNTLWWCVYSFLCSLFLWYISSYNTILVDQVLIGLLIIIVIIIIIIIIIIINQTQDRKIRQNR